MLIEWVMIKYFGLGKLPLCAFRSLELLVKIVQRQVQLWEITIE
jgi:hypothetical protein